MGCVSLSVMAERASWAKMLEVMGVARIVYYENGLYVSTVIDLSKINFRALHITKNKSTFALTNRHWPVSHTRGCKGSGARVAEEVRLESV